MDGRKEESVADRRFEREEMGELLRLFSSLGITVAAGIAGFFFIGLQADRRFGLAGWGKFCGLFAGLGLTLYWAYLRIARHLRRFEKPRAEEEPEKNEK